MFIVDSGLNTKVIRKETEDKIDRYCSQLFLKNRRNAIAVSCALNICNNNKKNLKCKLYTCTLFLTVSMLLHTIMFTIFVEVNK